LIIHVRTASAPTLVTVAGEIDLLTAPQLRDHVLALPDDDVVLDISCVRLLAAAGLWVMLDLQSRRARADAQLVLAAPSAPVRRVLRVTGVDQALPVAASVEDAVAFVTGGAAREGSGDPQGGVDGQNAVSTVGLPRPPRQRGKALS
jgi:anti-sigma B factor antagonist